MKTLLLPPANLFLLGLFGLVVARWSRLGGRALVILALLLFYLLSTPAVSTLLIDSLQGDPALPVHPTPLPDAGAIVVLSADVRKSAPEYGSDSLGPLTLERLRYGAYLHRQLGLPLLVTGGQIPESDDTLATMMVRSLKQDFGIAVRWREGASLNTEENAKFSAEILRGEGIGKIYLVTHAWHMPRAKARFEAEGLAVVPAPTGFVSRDREFDIKAFLPSAQGMEVSAFAVYEYLGSLRDRLARD